LLVPDEFLTVAEVASILKLNQQTIRNSIDAGTLPAVRVGPRRVRIDALMESGYSPAASAESSGPTPNIWDGGTFRRQTSRGVNTREDGGVRMDRVNRKPSLDSSRGKLV
jgi:excisionase family DNA binding protein